MKKEMRGLDLDFLALVEQDIETYMNVERQRIKTEHEGHLRPYFGIFEGVPALRSTLPEVTIKATEQLIADGKFIEQKGLDGDSLISLNENRNTEG